MLEEGVTGFILLVILDYSLSLWIEVKARLGGGGARL